MKRHNPMKKAFYFFAVLLLLSCHHASQKGHTVSVRIDPDEAEIVKLIFQKYLRRVAGHGRLRPHPLGRHGKTDNKRHPAQDARGQDIHSGRRDELPACVPRGRDTRLLHRPTRKGGQRVLMDLGLPCHGRTPLPVGPYRAKDSGM